MKADGSQESAYPMPSMESRLFESEASNVGCMQPPPEHGVVRWGIFESIGIFAVSVSGHSSLPVLRNSMKQPQVPTLLIEHHSCDLCI